MVVLFIVALVAGASAMWYFTMQKWALPYQEIKATWRIQGLCTNAQAQAPVKGAEVTATFREPMAFKHHWRNPPALEMTNVVTKTDDQGRFELTGEGGAVYVKAKAEGYREPEPWENWSYSARNGISRVDTNIVLSLEPISKSLPDEKASNR